MDGKRLVVLAFSNRDLMIKFILNYEQALAQKKRFRDWRSLLFLSVIAGLCVLSSFRDSSVHVYARSGVTDSRGVSIDSSYGAIRVSILAADSLLNNLFQRTGTSFEHWRITNGIREFRWLPKFILVENLGPTRNVYGIELTVPYWSIALLFILRKPQVKHALARWLKPTARSKTKSEQPTRM